ncbi:hypothetical protein VCHA53O466_40411 [Vibrio chagasii]|nr:hypothetical protein VCHA53O466_40411 [Vibrio chagasii]
MMQTIDSGEVPELDNDTELNGVDLDEGIDLDFLDDIDEIEVEGTEIDDEDLDIVLSEDEEVQVLAEEIEKSIDSDSGDLDFDNEASEFDESNFESEEDVTTDELGAPEEFSFEEDDALDPSLEDDDFGFGDEAEAEAEQSSDSDNFDFNEDVTDSDEFVFDEEPEAEFDSEEDLSIDFDTEDFGLEDETEASGTSESSESSVSSVSSEFGFDDAPESDSEVDFENKESVDFSFGDEELPTEVTDFGLDSEEDNVAADNAQSASELKPAKKAKTDVFSKLKSTFTKNKDVTSNDGEFDSFAEVTPVKSKKAKSKPSGDKKPISGGASIISLAVASVLGGLVTGVTMSVLTPSDDSSVELERRYQASLSTMEARLSAEIARATGDVADQVMSEMPNASDIVTIDQLLEIEELISAVGMNVNDVIQDMERNGADIEAKLALLSEGNNQQGIDNEQYKKLGKAMVHLKGMIDSGNEASLDGYNELLELIRLRELNASEELRVVKDSLRSEISDVLKVVRGNQERYRKLQDGLARTASNETNSVNDALGLNNEINIVKGGEVSQPKLPVYELRGVMTDRVFINMPIDNGSSYRLLSFRVGDTIEGYGKVESINQASEEVMTSSGLVNFKK